MAEINLYEGIGIRSGDTITLLTPPPNGDIRHAAAGNLGFLLSVIRCGEKLSDDEEQNVRRVIKELEVASTPEPLAGPSAGAMMPRWKCHKEVFAFKIKEINLVTGADEFGAQFLSDEGVAWLVSKVYLEKHNPKIDGYYVLYDGGYESWSPAKAFEEGYTRIP